MLGVPCYTFRSPVHAHFALGFRSLSLRFLQGFLISGFAFTGERRGFCTSRASGGRGGGEGGGGG